MQKPERLNPKLRKKTIRAPSEDYSHSNKSSSSVLKGISQAVTRTSTGKKRRNQSLNTPIKSFVSSFNKEGHSGHTHADSKIEGASESHLNFLNSTINNTQYIEQSVPQALSEIQNSVSILKKCYQDLITKKKKLGRAASSMSFHNNSQNTQNNSRPTIKEGKMDIDTLQKEYEKVHHKKTKDIQLLYDFYINEYLNRSKSTNVSNHTKTYLNSSINKATKADECILPPPESFTYSEKSRLPLTPVNTNRLAGMEASEYFTNQSSIARKTSSSSQGRRGSPERRQRGSAATNLSGDSQKSSAHHSRNGSLGYKVIKLHKVDPGNKSGEKSVNKSGEKTVKKAPKPLHDSVSTYVSQSNYASPKVSTNVNSSTVASTLGSPQASFNPNLKKSDMEKLGFLHAPPGIGGGKSKNVVPDGVVEKTSTIKLAKQFPNLNLAGVLRSSTGDLKNVPHLEKKPVEEKIPEEVKTGVKKMIIANGATNTVEEMKKSVPISLPITPLNNLHTMPNVTPLTLQTTPINVPLGVTVCSSSNKVSCQTTTNGRKPYMDFSIPWNKNGSTYEKPKSRENSPKNVPENPKKEHEKLTLKDEIYSKIFAKNMLINQMKQNLTETIQSHTTKNAGSFEKQKEFEVALYQFQNMQHGGQHKSELEFLDQKAPAAVEWIDQKETKEDDNTEEITEEEEDSRDFLGYLDKIRPLMPQQQYCVPTETTPSLNLDESKQAFLNSYDKKVLEDLAKMSDLISHNNKVLTLKEVVENPSMAFYNLRKKIQQDDAFKTNKFYVPEIPVKKPSIKDVDVQNEEESKKHKEELERFKAEKEILLEFENILDISESLVLQHKGNEPKTITKRGLMTLENDFVIDEKDFLNGLTKCEPEERTLTSESYSIDLELSRHGGGGAHKLK